jgi:hypothetical protein
VGPQLQASQNFLVLQEELRSTENRIGFARQHYNDSVMRYRAFKSPTNLVARLLLFSSAAMFATPDAGVDFGGTSARWVTDERALTKLRACCE